MFTRLADKYFPYSKLRPHQQEAIEFTYHIFHQGRIGLLNSPCGTGKSVSVLTGYLMARESCEAGKLFILTRVINQLEIYCRELKRIREHSGVNLAAAVFKNRRDMCPLIQEDEALRRMNYPDFLAYCHDAKEEGAGSTCRYYQGTYSRGRPTVEAIGAVQDFRDTGPLMPEDVYRICRNRGICPYEVTKLLARNVDVIVGNYNYVLVEPIRRALLSLSGPGLEEINCVFDEAHGLPEYAASILSDELSVSSVRRAADEVERYGVDDGGLVRGLERAMGILGEEAAKECGLDCEYLLPKDRLLTELKEDIGVSSEDELSELATNLESSAENIRSSKAQEGKPPSSYLGRLAEFLMKWLEEDRPLYVHYAKTYMSTRERAYQSLGVRCLDPAVAANVINGLRSAILMSGTLWNQQYYVDILGLNEDRVERLSLPSPFPRDRRLLVVDRGVTTKYESRNLDEWRRIAHHLEALVSKIRGRTIVYFPSYDIMKTVVKLVSVDVPQLMEAHKTRFDEVLEFLMNNSRCVVYGVARGKISEGVDLTLEEASLLSAVLIVGLPYPRKTPLLDTYHDYLQARFGAKAREYVNDIPCANTLAQCAGRLIRSEEDRGVIAILDRRAGGQFRRRLPEDWRRDLIVCDSLEELEQQVEGFLSRGVNPRS